ncbi:fibronectin type III domain-containing protein [Flavobacterium anhuiense]|uniref:fibronectin type III domain-containing protein n=1 Tax=Flavobacterium anhuiense TaxID=459526 RepID=UPI003D971C25
MKQTLLKNKLKLVLGILFLMPLFSHANYKSSFYFQTIDNEAPTAPTNAKAYQTFATTCSINWTSSTDNVRVASYEIYNGTVLIGTTDQSEPYFKITGLTELTTYTFSVKAKDDAGNTSVSSNLIIVTTPDGTKPTAPTNLAASDITATSVNLSWMGSTDNVGVTGYSIYNNTFTLWAKVDASTRTYIATGLKQSTTYNFSIQATDAAFNSSLQSNVVVVKALDIIAPTTPTNLSSSDITTTSINLSWTASSDSEGVTDYEIYQGGNLLIGTTSKTNYTITGLKANNFYSFSVIARDAAGNVSPATVPLVCETLDAIPPTPPTNLAASEISDTSVNLSWTASTDNKKVTEYVIYNGTDLIATSTTNSFKISRLTPETTYNLTVRAMDALENTSEESNTVVIKTLPKIPTYCVAIGLSQMFDEFITRVKIGSIDNVSGVSSSSYSDYTNLSTDLKKGEPNLITIKPREWIKGRTQFGEQYAVWIDYNGDKDFYDAGEMVWYQSTTTESPVLGTFVIPETAITGATRMRVGIRYAANPSPCGDYTGTYNYGEIEDYTINIVNNTISQNRPDAPTNLVSSGTTPSTTNLTWTAPSNTTNITSYEIYQGSVLIGSSQTNNFTVTGLAQATSYLFTVKSKNANDELSVSSTPVIVKTLTDTPPTAPTALTASDVTPTKATLTWNPSINSSGSITYKITSNNAFVAYTNLSTYTVTNLQNNTNYSFQVEAADSEGQSSIKSDPVLVTTLIDKIPPTAPTNLRTSNTTTTTTTFSWDKATDDQYIKSYSIYNDTFLVAQLGPNTTSYDFKDLKEGTTYTFTVKAYDSGSNETSGSLSVTTVATPKYCIPGSTAQSNDDITNVTMGKINNSASSGVYSDFKSTGGFVVPGQENTISISVSKYYSAKKPSGLAFWIDLNGDADFDDEGELIFSTIITADRFTAIQKFTIPVTVSPKRTKMRIILKENGIPTPCEKFYNGAIQDYILDIKQPIIEFEAPSIPVDLNVSNITKNSAVLSWKESTDNIAVTGYDIYQGNALIGSTNLTTYTVNGLNAETVYSFTLKAKDYANNTSALSDPISFTTSSLSIDEHDSKMEQYILFPNPAIQKLFIQRPNNNGMTLYKISNLNGQNVLYGHLNENGIEVNHLSSGVYIIELKDDEKTIVKKFIKK